jgi:UDPglucose--hexose-1-phosphate uridylyltransferase
VPELRRDPLTDEWVVVAAERGQRPHLPGREGPTVVDRRARDEGCPLCPGNEAQTPPAVLARPEVGAWRVRVVPNKYPIVAHEPGRSPAGASGLLLSAPAVGGHEVIVESPLHWRPIGRMEPDEVELLLSAYRDRYRALAGAPWARYVVVFKNHGPAAGTSLAHPHSQLVALETLPEAARRRRAIARAHRARTGRWLHEDVVTGELRAAERVVAETAGFVVHCPFASRAPFELQISPRAGAACFGDLGDAELAELAVLLRDTLARLERALDDPDFNYVVHSAPAGDPEAGDEVWRIAVVPRLHRPGGFELASGLDVNTVRPEEAAARLRLVGE